MHARPAVTAGRPSTLPKLSARSSAHAAAATAVSASGRATTPPPLSSSHGRLPNAASATSPSPAAAAAAAAASTTASGGTAAAPSMVVFADLPDQLLCSPDNAVWVYGQYALSYFASESAAQAKLEKKILAMVREAQRHYDVSCAFFASLTAEEQRVEVLRSAGAGLHIPSSMTAATAASGSSNNTAAGQQSHGNNVSAAGAQQGRSAAAGGVNAVFLTAGDGAQAEENLYKELRRDWPACGGEDDDDNDGCIKTNSDADDNTGGYSPSSAWPGQKKNGREGAAAAAKPSLFSTRVGRAAMLSDDGEHADGGGENASSASFYISPGLRVHLVLDIIASRKTLGATPLRSRAYSLAEALYRRVMYPTTSPSLSSLSPAVTGEASMHAATAKDGKRGPALSPSPPTAAKASKAESSMPSLAAHVRTLIIGISDTDGTLVGRDVVCPYRHMPQPSAPQMRLRNVLEAMAEAQKQRPLSPSPNIAAAAAAAAAVGGGGADALSSSPPPVPLFISSPSSSSQNAAPLASLVAQQLMQRKSIEGLLMPTLTRVPPVLLGQLDQTRLILCAPPVDWSTADSA